MLQAREAHLDYRLRTKPFNFIQSPILSEINGCPEGVDKSRFTLIAPFESDSSKWLARPYVNTHDGKSYRLSPPDRKPLTHAAPKTLEDVISRYRWHREAKSLAPDGSPCKERTRGLLSRMPVVASGVIPIGKETDRRWEQGEDISILNADIVQYRPDETARLLADPLLPDELSDGSIRKLAKAAGISETTVKRAKAAKRIQKRKAEALRRAVQQLLSKA